VDREAAGQHQRSVGLAADPDDVAVGLVVDLAHQLLEQVLHGDDAGGGAVLVHHQGQLEAPHLHLVQHVEHARRLGKGGQLPRSLPHRPLARPQQVTQVDHADHVVEVAVVRHRCPRMTAVDQCPERLGHRLVGVEHEHVRPRSQHLVQGAVGDLERPVDDQALLGGEGGLRTDQLAQLGLGDLFPLHRGVAAHQAHGDVGGARQQPHGGAGHGRQRARRQQRPAFGPLHGYPLGGELADHQGGVRQHQGDHDDRHRAGGAAQEAEGFLQGLSQRHRRRRRGQEPSQRDADLDRGQEPVGVAGQARHQRPGRRALLELLELALAQRHQGHLGAGEGGVDQHQHEHEPELQPETAHSELPGWPGGQV
jgi:hypothetical protein